MDYCCVLISEIKCSIWGRLLLCVCPLKINWNNLENGASVLRTLVGKIKIYPLFGLKSFFEF